jgi:hypothetical protein
MPITFEYGVARVKDLAVYTTGVPGKRPEVSAVELNGRRLEPTKRFWHSLHLRFGFTGNIFRYFSHQEVFERISQVAPNDRVRYCIEHDGLGHARLLGVCAPTAAVMPYDELRDLLARYEAEEVEYDEGVVRSRHAPPLAAPFDIAGDAFVNKFVLEVPIDGFGRAAVHLSLLRLVCANGAVAASPAFRSEVALGKAQDAAGYALVRVLEGFNNEEGFAALRQRFESAASSWASVREVQSLRTVLAGICHRGQLRHGARRLPGTDGASTLSPGSALWEAFSRLAGNLEQMYGMANIDTLTAKRQRTLPAACKVYELINFASEVATHHTQPAGNRALQGFVGDLLANEFDLEGTAERFGSWRDFFLADERVNETLALRDRRS